MRRRRVRWGNVAKLTAGVFAALAAIVTLPSLLRGPQPPPPPPDVGLAPVRPAGSGQFPADAVGRDQGRGHPRRCRGGAGSDPRLRRVPVTRLGRKLRALQRAIGDSGLGAITGQRGALQRGPGDPSRGPITDRRCAHGSPGHHPAHARPDARGAGRRAASSTAPGVSSSPANAPDAPSATSPAPPAPSPAPPAPSPAPTASAPAAPAPAAPAPAPAPSAPAPAPPPQPTPVQQEFGL
jgi:hypothetical protein